MPEFKTLNGILAYIDLVNFTAQANQLGDKLTAQFTQYFQDKIKSLVEKQGFVMVKTLGDAVLIFGTELAGILEIMKDLFQRDKLEDKYGFQARFRMVAHTGYFQFLVKAGKPVDLVSAEGIKVFRLEKHALAWELVVTHELYRGLKGLLTGANIDAHRLALNQPLKGFDAEEWFPPFYKLRIMKEIPGAGGILERRLAELEEDVQTIPVFGNIFPEVPMAENFINLALVCDEDMAPCFPDVVDKSFSGVQAPRRGVPIMNFLQKSPLVADEEPGPGPHDRDDDRDNWIFQHYRGRFHGRDFADKFQEIDVNALYERFKQGIIFGLPGAGKTTILRHLAFKEFAANKAQKEQTHTGQVVLFVSCRGVPFYDDWYKERYGEDKAVIDINPALEYMTWGFLFGKKLAADLTPGQLEGFTAAVQQVKQAFAENRLTLLVDALDEAPDRPTKERIREVFLALVSGNRLYLTSRPSERVHLKQDPQQRDKIPEFDVRSLEMDQVRKIARQIIPGTSPEYKRFDEALWQEEVVRKMAATPMTALLVTAYFTVFAQFDHRFPMYDLLVKFILLNTWENMKEKSYKYKDLELLFRDIKKPGFFEEHRETHILYDALALLCYELFYDSPGGEVQRSVNEETLLLHFSEFMEQNLYYHDKDKSALQSHRWLEQFQRDHFLVQAGPTEYMFVHGTVMEYLAAYYLAGQRQRQEDRFVNLVHKTRAREAYLELETVPIACGSDMLTGYKILDLLRDLWNEGDKQDREIPYPRERLAEFGVKCLAELEWLTEKTLGTIRIERLKTPFYTLIHQNREAVRWLYLYLKEQVLGGDKGALQKAGQRFGQQLKLCRKVFLEEYLDYGLLEKGDSEWVDLRKQLLGNLVQKHLLEQWLAVKAGPKAGEPGNLLQLDSAGYHPEDKNFAYYKALIGPELKGFFGSPNMKHSEPVRACAFSPDGKTVVSGSEDCTLKLWEVASGKEIRTFTGHKGEVLSCAFSPEGKYVVSASLDKTLKLWEVSSGKEIRTFKGHEYTVFSCAFSPKGKYVVSASEDNTLKLWEVASGKEIRTFTGHKYSVWDCAFSPDGTLLVSASEDNTLKLWEVSSGREIRTFTGHKNVVYSCAFSPEGKYLVSASRDQTLKLWEVESGREIRTFSGHKDCVLSCAFSPEGKYLVSASKDNTVKLWEVESGKEIRTFTGHKSWVSSCAYSPEGQYVVSASWDNTIKLWEVESGREIRTFTGHKDNVDSCAYSPEGQYVVSASWDKTLKLWDAASGKEIRTFTGHNSYVASCAFSPEGQYVVSASGDKTLKLWEVESGKEIRTFTGHNGYVYSCAYSPEGQYVVSAPSDNTLKLWGVSGVESGKEIRTFIGHKGTVWGCAFSPEGKYVVSASFDHTLKLWEVESGQEIRTFTGHKNEVWGCAFAPDDKYLVSASADKTLKLWDVVSGREIRTFTGHKSGVDSCVFSPEGKYVVSASFDHTLKLWEVESGACIKTLTLPWIPRSVAFSPANPHRVVTANLNGTLTMFDFGGAGS